MFNSFNLPAIEPTYNNSTAFRIDSSVKRSDLQKQLLLGVHDVLLDGCSVRGLTDRRGLVCLSKVHSPSAALACQGRSGNLGEKMVYKMIKIGVLSPVPQAALQGEPVEGPALVPLLTSVCSRRSSPPWCTTPEGSPDSLVPSPPPETRPPASPSTWSSST